MIIVKACTKCGEEKPLTEFHKWRLSKDGHRACCKACRSDTSKSEARREFFAQPPECHTDRERYAKGLCRPCYNDAYYEGYWQRNPGKRQQIQKAAYDRNPEARRASSRKWKLAHPAEVAAQMREWRANHSDEMNDFYAKRRAQQSGTAGELVSRRIVWERDGGTCGICGLLAREGNWHLDHIVPLAREGKHIYENVRVAHPKCNIWKKDRLDSELPPIPSWILAAATKESIGANQAEAA